LPDEDDLKNKTENRRFIREKIVRPKLTKAELFKRFLLLVMGAVLFGFLAAVTFVVSQPLAKKYLIEVEEQTSPPVTVSIPKDELETSVEPETTERTEPETAAKEETTETETETEPIEEIVREEVGRYPFSLDDLVKMHSSMNELFRETDQGIVTVHSVKTEMDWFNNPVEMSGLYAGAVIAATPEEYLILTPIGAVEGADSLAVTLPGGGQVTGELKGTDRISHMAVIRIDSGQLDETMKKQLKVLDLGNSYAVKQGDLVFTAGSPAGMVHSFSMGSISYIAKNISVVDGMSRLFYTDAKGEASQGTFLFNTRGQVIGWVTDDYQTEGGDMTVIRALSDYKGVLEDLSNGIAAPYFGIMGIEVTEARRQEGLPLGVYVNTASIDGPAYNAGIQSGDIITRLGMAELATMKDFQNCLDKLSSGDVVTVEIQRYGQNRYTPIEYEVTIGAR